MATKKMKSIEDQITEWTPEECLENFYKFFSRVNISTQFIQNEEKLITHQILAISCDDKIMVSDPEQLEWPLQLLPMPEAFKKEMN